MKKLTMMLAVVATSFAVMTGCTTTQQGELAGKALYNGYLKIAETQGDEFAGKVQKLWARIDAIETVAELSDTWKAITADLDDLIDNQNIKGWQKDLLKKIRAEIDEKIAKVIDDEVENNKAAMEFLVAIRNQIRKMIEDSAKK